MQIPCFFPNNKQRRTAFPSFFITLASDMAQRVPTELGEKPIGILLMNYALPAIMAMVASSLYNIVDRAFIGHYVGTLALGGLTATFPFMNLGAAFGAMVGVGACTVISVRLGQKDYATAQNVLGNTITLNLILGTLFTIVCLTFLDPILQIFGASGTTLPYAREYMQIVLAFNVISHSYLGLNAIMRAAGHPITAMALTLCGVMVNAALDPLFIIVLDMGIRGAAIATIISQSLALAAILLLFSRKSELLHLRRGIYKLKTSIVRQTLAIGMSPFLMNSCACLVVLLLNRSMQEYGGDNALAAYGIVNSIAFVFIMIVMGLNQGMQPIAGYNWGAHQNDRVWQVLRYTMTAATAVTIIGFLTGMFIPEMPARIFTNDEQIVSMAAHGFRICVLIFPLVGGQIVVSHFFQSIGHAGKSIFLSLSRQLIFLIPGILILPKYLGLDGVWYSMPFADAMSCIIAATLLWWQVRHIRSKEESKA